MSTVKRMVCLANSRKLQGRCVAGRQLVRGQPTGWLRPVSARPDEEVSKDEREYEDGSDPRLLDVIDVPLLEAKPKTFQQENWLLDPNRPWVKVGTANLDQVSELVEYPDPLWINGHHTYSGYNDKVPLSIAQGLRTSLALLRVEKFWLSVFSPGAPFNNPKRRVQGQFMHAGSEYHLWVTDPDCTEQYLGRPNGEYYVGESYLTVSLAEPYEGNCYKLIAAVIDPAMATSGERA